MQNERMAVRQKLADAYRGQLAFVQKRVDEKWQAALAQLDGAETGAALFARAVSDGWANSVICLEDAGHMTYPQMGGHEQVLEANAQLLALENDPANPQLASSSAPVAR